MSGSEASSVSRRLPAWSRSSLAVTDPPDACSGSATSKRPIRNSLTASARRAAAAAVFALASARFACQAAAASPADQRGHHENRGRDADAIAPDELREPVAEGVGTRLDGLALAMPPRSPASAVTEAYRRSARRRSAASRMVSRSPRSRRSSRRRSPSGGLANGSSVAARARRAGSASP